MALQFCCHAIVPMHYHCITQYVHRDWTTWLGLNSKAATVGHVFIDELGFADLSGLGGQMWRYALGPG